jgi:ABC-type transport system involved in multi-copper enzyme maturation permease subunit
MSAQTGVERSAEPRSSRFADRVLQQPRTWRDHPNPLWMREMRQAARVQATPIALAAITILMTLLIGSVGGLMGSSKSSPAEIGAVLFHTFFSLAYFVVALVGPALGANAIASEREGKTWEALLLTGLRPEVVARGKFFSATTSIALYIVMLAPVGALPFLFGGVTPGEVLLAFVVLFGIALVAVGFGLALSAKTQSMRGALVIALLSAVPLSIFAYTLLGVGGASLARELWSAPTSRGLGPIWLPVAYGAAPFGADYVLFLVVLPLLVVLMPAWFLYEVSLANLTSVTEDRSFGLKRWFLVAIAVLVALSSVSYAYRGTHTFGRAFGVVGLAFLGYATFGAYLFATEPIGPSRRVAMLLASRGRWRRALSPGVVPTLALQRWSFRVGFIVVVLVDLFCAYLDTRPGSAAVYTFGSEVRRVLVWGGYVLAFAEFVFGLVAYLRARSKGGSGVRPILLAVLFGAFAGPWVFAAILGILAKGGDAIVAAPSPLYVLTHVFPAIRTSAPGRDAALLASGTAAFGYLVAGVALARVGARRARQIIDEHRAVLADAELRLAQEDEVLRSAALEAEASIAAPSTEGVSRPSEAEKADPSPSLADPSSSDQSA